MNVPLKHLSGLFRDPYTKSTGAVEISTSGLTERLGSSFSKVIEIEMEEIRPGAEYRFKQVRLDSLDVESQSKYLYRSGGTSGPGVTITCKLRKSKKTDRIPRTAGQQAQTALQKKVIGYLRKMAEIANTQEAKEFANALCSALADRREVALEQMTKHAQEVGPTKDDAIITLVVVSGSTGRSFPEDISMLGEFFLQCVNPETGELKGTRSVGENAVCSCCGKLSPQVFCQPQTLPYFTFDKPGFIAGGFFGEEECQQKAWRNFPLCSECVLDVRSGFKKAEANLRFSLCNINYLLIPNFTGWETPDVNIIVKTVAGFAKSTEPEMQRDQELLFLRRLGRQSITASFSYLFYRKKQSRMEILCTIENVLPSRMSEIADAIDRTEEHYLLARFGEWTRA
ncbi:MAG: TM1802 family CRISPR-associated protein, partial [Blastocatellia bacterium]